MSRVFILSVALALIATPAFAQSQAGADSPFITALKACRTVTNPDARLACFDRSTAAIVEGVAKGELAVIDREKVRKVRRSLFGFSLPEFPFFAGGKDQDKEAEPKELMSTITSFSATGNGRYRLGIADGQAVWETTESALLNDPRTGTKIEIKSGMLGSYFVSIGGQKWVRARRVR